MLLRVILENFLSFDEPVQFDMFPNVKRTTFAEHIYSQDVPVLKQAAIYGANGAGKSNLVKGIAFLRHFAIEKGFLSRIELNRYFFQLKENVEVEPMKLLIEFKQVESYFIYSVEISKDGIEKEELYQSGKGSGMSQPIFIREKSAIKLETEVPESVAVATQRMLEKNPFSSLIALNQDFPIVEDERVKKAFNWFEVSLTLIDVNSNLPALLELMYEDEALMRFTNQLFFKLDLGIKELKVDSKDFDSWLSKHVDAKLPKAEVDSMKPGESLTHFTADRQVFSISMENGIRKVREFLFQQFGKGGYIGNMDILSQSDGTVRLLTLVPAIYRAAYEEDRTIVIDEIDHGIHPSLICGLVKYFAQNKETKGQLIFTTHETCLLNQKEIMRPDEVWFAQKKEGATQLYSLNDFKIHNSISIENGYLEGRYGGIPFIGSLD